MYRGMSRQKPEARKIKSRILVVGRCVQSASDQLNHCYNENNSIPVSAATDIQQRQIIEDARHHMLKRMSYTPQPLVRRPVRKHTGWTEQAVKVSNSTPMADRRPYTNSSSTARESIATDNSSNSTKRGHDAASPRDRGGCSTIRVRVKSRRNIPSVLPSSEVAAGDTFENANAAGYAEINDYNFIATTMTYRSNTNSTSGAASTKDKKWMNDYNYLSINVTTAPTSIKPEPLQRITPLSPNLEGVPMTPTSPVFMLSPKFPEEKAALSKLAVPPPPKNIRIPLKRDKRITNASNDQSDFCLCPKYDNIDTQLL